MFYIGIIFFPLSFKIITSENPDMAPFMKDVTTNLFVTFDNRTKEDRPSTVLDMMNATRRYLMADYPHVDHYGNTDEKIIACYYTAVTYRAAMWDLRRYFELRYLYAKTMEFEVGYLCHEIIFRYQLILELYQLTERKFTNFEDKNYAAVTYMFYMYTNILEQSKVIIHLCHMLHEVEKKYRKERGVFDDYADPRGAQTVNRSAVIESELAHERWLQRKRQEERKRAKERKQYLKELHKFGLTTKKKITTAKGSWPLQYGWSIENW